MNVGSGDVNNDGFDDIIVGLGPGGAPQVKGIDGNTGETLQNFLAFNAGFPGGVRVSGGDVTGDGRSDIITGASAGGGPHVRAFNGETGIRVADFFAFGRGFTGGVFVSSGDVNSDGRADIIVGSDSGRTAEVRVFDAATSQQLSSANPFGGFSGGVSVAGTDVTNDGIADVVVAQASGSGTVAVLDGTDLSTLDDVFGLDGGLAGGLLLGSK